MKQLFLIAFLAIGLLGCQNPERNAFKTTGTIVITANGAMSGWLDYKNTHTVPVEQIAKVKAGWDKFYAADQVEKQAIASFKTNTDTNSLNVAMGMASAASSELIGLILQFLPPANAAALKGAK